MIDAFEFHLKTVRDDAAELDGLPARQLPIDRYVAASLMQKAIRRGEVEWATDSAFTLLQIDSRYLWRRLIITLFEDVGLHDTRLAWRVLASRQHCLRLGIVAWPTVSLIVREMSVSPKSQTGNHVLQLATAEAREARSVDFLIDRPLAEATRWATDVSRSIPERVHAIWAIFGLRLGGITSPNQHPEGSSAAGWAAFDRIVLDGEIRALARAGVQAGASILAVSAALSAPNDSEIASGQSSDSDPMPPYSLFGGVPSWAFDMYTRAGKRALTLASRRCATIRAVLHQHNVPSAQHSRVLGSIHFELESACLKDRIQRPQDLAFLSTIRASAAAPWMDTSAELDRAFLKDWGVFQSVRRWSYEEGDA